MLIFGQGCSSPLMAEMLSYSRDFIGKKEGNCLKRCSTQFWLRWFCLSVQVLGGVDLGVLKKLLFFFCHLCVELAEMLSYFKRVHREKQVNSNQNVKKDAQHISGAMILSACTCARYVSILGFSRTLLLFWGGISKDVKLSFGFHLGKAWRF